MYWLAMKMLFRQKMRLIITLIGITISAGLKTFPAVVKHCGPLSIDS